MSVEIKIPNQVDLTCNVCDKQVKDELIHKLELKGKIAIVLQLCDTCICDLKDALKDY